MGDFSGLLTIVVALSAVLAMVAGGIAYFKTQVGQSVITYQRQEIDALKDRLGTEEQRAAELTARVVALETENKVLKNLVTQEQAIAALTTALQAHHQASELTWGKILAVLDTALKASGPSGRRARGDATGTGTGSTRPDGRER